MNSSLPRAAERRADDGPVDPGDVVAGLVLARARDVGADASARAPHAAEREADHAPARDERERPAAIATPPTTRDVEVDVEARLRRDLETAGLDVEGGRVPAAVADLGEEAGPEEDAVQEHRHEQLLDVLGRHVAAAGAAPPTRGPRG